ncbi:MAG: hypothetical protein M3P49_04610 [Actinomycetota bacterium]|nr:hypothetical protein [Actinomycetota bacterium]
MNGPDSLRAEAQRIVEDCENILDMAAETINALPEELSEAQRRQALARDDEAQAEDEYYNALDSNLSEQRQVDARQRRSEANRRWRKEYELIASEYFDLEYRKTVVRQVAGILSEESLRRLDRITTRVEDAESQRAVAECKDEVSRAVRYVLKRFAAPRSPQQDEVRKARTEAHELLEGWKTLL